MKEYTVKVFDNKTEWYFEGKLHREDGHAVEWSDGDKHWYKNGKRHREDGPAIEYNNGYKAWYLKGKYLTKEEFDKAIKAKAKATPTCENKCVEVDGIKYKLVKI